MQPLDTLTCDIFSMDFSCLPSTVTRIKQNVHMHYICTSSLGCLPTPCFVHTMWMPRIGYQQKDERCKAAVSVSKVAARNKACMHSHLLLFGHNMLTQNTGLLLLANKRAAKWKHIQDWIYDDVLLLHTILQPRTMKWQKWVLMFGGFTQRDRCKCQGFWTWVKVDKYNHISSSSPIRMWRKCVNLHIYKNTYQHTTGNLNNLYRNFEMMLKRLFLAFAYVLNLNL